jgi:hypothetical protein
LTILTKNLPAREALGNFLLDVQQACDHEGDRINRIPLSAVFTNGATKMIAVEILRSMGWTDELIAGVLSQANALQDSVASLQDIPDDVSSPEIVTASSFCVGDDSAPAGYP